MRIKLCLLLFSFCCAMQSVNAADKPLILGIHPYKTPSKLIKVFTPLARHISQQINVPVEVHISKDYQTHIDNIGNKKINIGYLGPASYIKLTRQYGKKPILARLEINGKPTFQGKIIVRQESPFKTLADLKNTLFAFGDPNSTMSHLVPRFMLSEAGIRIPGMLKHKFLGSHDNVALGVLTGDFDAGAVKEAVYYKYQERGLRELASTPVLSEHLFVTCGKVPAKLQNKISSILIDLGKSEYGRAILKDIKQGMTAMRSAKDSDYDNLRHILDTLSKQGVEW